MDNLESNIDLNQILAALQHLQQENVVLRNLVNRLQDQPQPPAPVPVAPAMVAPKPKISHQKSSTKHAPNFEAL
jgi:hypothetical protein